MGGSLKTGISVLGGIVLTIVGLFKKVLKPFFFLAVIFFLVATIIMLIGWTVGSIFVLPLSSFIIPGHSLFAYLMTTSAYLTLAIPLLSLFYWLTTRFRRYSIKPSIRRGFRVLWCTSIVVTGISIFTTVRDHLDSEEVFSYEAYDIEADTVHVNVIDPNRSYYHTIYNFDGIDYTGDKIFFENIKVDFHTAENDQLRIDRTVHALGRSNSRARKNAERLQHSIEYGNGEITIPSQSAINKGNKLRGQMVEYDIYVPEGKELVFDNRSGYNHNFQYNFDKDMERPRYHQMSKYSWTMGKNGMFSSEWIENYNFTRTIPLSQIENFNIKGDLEVTVKPGDKNQLLLIGVKNQVEDIELIEQENLINIIRKRDNRVDDKIQLVLISNNIKNIVNYSDRPMRMEGMNQEQLHLELMGRGDIQGYVDIEHLHIRSEYAKDIELVGSGKTLSIHDTGKGNYDARNYKIEALKNFNRLQDSRFDVSKTIKTVRSIKNQNNKITGSAEIELVESIPLTEIIK